MHMLKMISFITILCAQVGMYGKEGLGLKTEIQMKIGHGSQVPKCEGKNKGPNDELYWMLE